MTRESRGTGEQMSRGAGEQKFLRSLTPLLPSSLFPLLLAWCGALTLAVYGRSLALPFFFDDLVLLPYVAETPLRQLWLEPAVFPYFRPLPPTFWRLSYVLWGAHQPVWLHGWNLLLQALNAWLVGYLAVRLLGQVRSRLPGKSWLLAGSSATFYLLFPFHFQATPWITAVYHLWVTTFILASVAAYERYCFTNQWRWAAAGSLVALAALLTQENGVLIAPLILVLALLSGGGWQRLAANLALAVAFADLAAALAGRAAHHQRIGAKQSGDDSAKWGLAAARHGLSAHLAWRLAARCRGLE
jgi:hypothetical protein